MAGGNTVQPIRDTQIIERFKRELLRGGLRDYLLFMLGINVGLRISDILKLRVSDVQNSHISIREGKTDKSKRIKINASLRQELDSYTSGMQANDYLFPSQKGGAISRVQAYRILNDAGSRLGLTDIGTHTLRKTFGYHHYQKYHDVALLQELFNHSAPSVTLRYIGITQDMMDASMDDFSL